MAVGGRFRGRLTWSNTLDRKNRKSRLDTLTKPATLPPSVDASGRRKTRTIRLMPVMTRLSVLASHSERVFSWTHEMQIQRLRNLTTGLLHTKIQHMYEDLEAITGESKLLSYMLPTLIRAVAPWLQKHVADEQFWHRKHDPSHTGEIELPEPTADDRAAMFQRYRQLLNPPARRHVAEISDVVMD